MSLFPTVPNASTLGTGVQRFTRPSAPQVLPDLAFDFLADLERQVGDVRTERLVVVAAPGLIEVRRGLRVRQRREASVAQKCLATLATQRGWHTAFRRSYGIDYARALARPSWGAMIADVQNQVTDQLGRIAGVSSVGGFVWRRSGERAWLQVSVRLASGGHFALSTPVPPADRGIRQL